MISALKRILLAGSLLALTTATPVVAQTLELSDTGVRLDGIDEVLNDGVVLQS
jgi:hypothetical protein